MIPSLAGDSGGVASGSCEIRRFFGVTKAVVSWKFLKTNIFKIFVAKWRMKSWERGVFSRFLQYAPPPPLRGQLVHRTLPGGSKKPSGLTAIEALTNKKKPPVFYGRSGIIPVVKHFNQTANSLLKETSVIYLVKYTHISRTLKSHDKNPRKSAFHRTIAANFAGPDPQYPIWAFQGLCSAGTDTSGTWAWRGSVRWFFSSNLDDFRDSIHEFMTNLEVFSINLAVPFFHDGNLHPPPRRPLSPCSWP